MTLRLAELVGALSLATDLSMGQPIEHALRTCLIACRLGESLGLSDADLQDVFYVSLLRSTGCTADPHPLVAFFGDDIVAQAGLATLDPARPTDILGFVLNNAGRSQPPLQRALSVVLAMVQFKEQAQMGAVAHCEVAQLLAERLGLGAGVQQALGQVFDRWDGRGLSAQARGDALSVSIRVVHVARDAEIYYRLAGSDGAVAVVKDRSGAAYDPRIAERFALHARQLLDPLETIDVWNAMLSSERGEQRVLAGSEIDGAIRTVADFADLKSHHSVGHSPGVAQLAADATRRLRLPASDVVAVQRAGWLHDLGRAGVSAGVWSKAAALTSAEWERVRLHAYYTERVLSRVPLPDGVASLAAMHHERLDATGYHRGAAAGQITLPARVLAAADAYHAMLEPRPYRPALSPDRAAAELSREVQAGRLDPDAARAVLESAGQRAPSTRREWPAGLSDREVEVLRLAARGLSRREIGEHLSITERTAGHHLQHIYDKIGVSTRAGATLFAAQHDLV